MARARFVTDVGNGRTLTDAVAPLGGQLPQVFVATDTSMHPDPVAALAAAPLECAVLVRDKELAHQQRWQLVADFVAQARPTVVAVAAVPEATLDRWPAGIAGFQLPSRLLSDRRIQAYAATTPALWWGGSTHTAAELAAASWCDYVTFSPVFASVSKPGYQPTLLWDQIAGLVQAHPQVLALGGVTPQNLSKVWQLGVHGMVLLGSVWQSRCPAEVVIKVLSDLRRECRP